MSRKKIPEQKGKETGRNVTISWSGKEKY